VSPLQVICTSSASSSTTPSAATLPSQPLDNTGLVAQPSFFWNQAAHAVRDYLCAHNR
jgi:hypothetical protein